MAEVTTFVSIKILLSCAYVNNESESDSDSVSVDSAEPEDLDDLKQLANDIFRESENENYEFRGFYDDDTVRCVVTPMMKFNLSKVSMCILRSHFTMPDKFEDGIANSL